MEKISPQPNAGNAAESGKSVELVSDATEILPPSRRSSTPAQYVPVRKETIEKRLSRRLDLIDAELTDAEFAARIAKAPLKELAVAEGIYLDKIAQLRGQPNKAVGSDTRAKLTELGSALIQELNRRGLSVKLTERTIEAKLDGEDAIVIEHP